MVSRRFTLFTLLAPCLEGSFEGSREGSLEGRTTLSPEPLLPRLLSISALDSLTPAFATHPGNPFLTPLLATLPKPPSRKSFLCHTCAPLPQLSALPIQLSTFHFQPSYNLPYILPSSVSSNPFVFTLFKKLPGWGATLPIMELGVLASLPNATPIRGGPCRIP